MCVVFMFAAFISVEGGTLKLRENFCAGSFERLRSEQVSLYRRLAVLFSTCFAARIRRNIWSPHASRLPTSKKSCAVSSQTPVHTFEEILGAFYDSVLHEPFLVAEDLQRDSDTFFPAATVA